MKPFIIAATTLALTSGAAFAETATQPVVVPTMETAGDHAKAAADEAAKAAGDAAAAAGEAAKDATAAVGEAAGDAAKAAGDAAKDAGDAAKEAGDAAKDAANDAAAKTETVVVAPDVKAPALSVEHPGMLGSWITSRHIWTTNQPSSTAWADTALTERPADWQDIAKVDDVVFDTDGNLVGYVADIGGFLGIGAKKVLLGTDAIHLVKVGEDTFYATNFTKEELKALPDFDATTVMK